MNQRKILDDAFEVHQNFLIDSYIDQIEQRAMGRFLYSALLRDENWNLVTHITALPEQVPLLIEEAKQAYSINGLRPTFYCSTEHQQALLRAFKEQGLVEKFCDAWMFLELSQKSVAPLSGKLILQVCKTQEERDRYVTVFMRSFSGSDPHEPYGALPPTYAEATRRSFDSILPRGAFYHYLIMYEGVCAGCVLLGVADKLAGLYALGIVPEFRGKIFPRLLARHTIQKALEQGAEIAFLQTEAGSYNDKLFSKVGFKTFDKFVGIVIPEMSECIA